MARKRKDLEKRHPKTELKIEGLEEVNYLKWKWILLVFGFLLYVNTIKFDYVLDDKIVIVANQITKQGFGGAWDHFFYDSMDGFWAEQYGVSVEDLNKETLVAGGRYRPFSLFTYAIEWEFFGEKPGISHFINALLYGFTGWVLFVILLELFPTRKEDVWKSVAFLSTVIFLSHPLHVEVVANIKSRDEILSLLFGLWSLKFVLDYSKSTNTKELIKASALLFLSLLSKETTIAFVAMGPLMLYFFEKGNRSTWIAAFVSLFLAGLLYTVIRFGVLGSVDTPMVTELMNNPFLNATEGERLATIFLILTAYVKLLFLPFPLTHDYYPYHLPFLPEDMNYANWGSVPALIGALIIAVLLVVILKGFKSKNLLAFGALFFLGTSILISNLFFPIGVFMNERFMYVPSIIVSVLIANLLIKVLPAKLNLDNSRMGVIGVLTIAGIFSTLSINRSFAWENDESLALTDVQISLGSAKVKMAAADALLQEIPFVKNEAKKQELINEAYQYLSESLEIYPEYFPPLDLLGRLYFESRNYTESIKFYSYCVDRKPNDPKFVENIYIIGNKMVEEGLYQDAFYAYEKALSYSPNNKEYLVAAAQVSARDLNNPSQGLPFIEKAYQLFPSDKDVAEKTAITYAMLGRFQNAINILEPLNKEYPKSSTIAKNLGIAYYQMGDIQKGTELMNYATELEKLGS
ncbi:MAG: tetratricopeptide repeat protein [Salibacteraceae bacterium]